MKLSHIVKSDHRVQRGFAIGYALALLLVFLVYSPAQAASARLSLTPETPVQLAGSLTRTARSEAVAALSIEDYSRAYALLMPIAAGGDVVAQYYLASLHDAGLGVERNAAEAAYWYRQAAINGHPDAQYNLGVAYSRGDGVQRDMTDAARWWRAAALTGSLNAQFNLGLIYAHGEGVATDAVEASRWWNMAAAQGDPASQYNLGALYANGEGVSQDMQRARLWWQRAAAQGFRQAIEALSRLDNK